MLQSFAVTARSPDTRASGRGCAWCLVDLGFSVIVGNAADNVHKRVFRTDEPQNGVKETGCLAYWRGIEKTGFFVSRLLTGRILVIH
jgi:hypothetical protein